MPALHRRRAVALPDIASLFRVCLRNPFAKAAVALLCAILAFADAEGQDVLLHIPLDGDGRQLVDAGGNAVGLHYPASTADQDDQASTDPSRYRCPGRHGGSVRYFADDRSFSRMNDKALFTAPMAAIALYVDVKVTESPHNRFGSLVSTRTDSDKGGFDVFIWGTQVRFRFADGVRAYDVRASAPMLRDGLWHTLEATFEPGKAAIWIDGALAAAQDVEARVIAPPKRPLHLGGYPMDGRGRRQYAFDGWLDEITIGTHRTTTRAYLVDKHGPESITASAPPVRYSVQPIDGNERFFGGRKVFHTFRDHPVPLTFLFTSEPVLLADGDSPALVLYAANTIDVVAAHQSNHNEPGGDVGLAKTAVTRDGQPWTRYETVGIDLAAKGWKKGPFVSLGFDAGPDVDEAPIRYGLVYGGQEHELTEATVRFLAMPSPVPLAERGSFHVFGYFIMSAFAYPSLELQQASADLLGAIGLTGKGRFYDHDDYRAQFDEFLKTQGFTLYEAALWNGPDPYTIALDREQATSEYVARVADNLTPNGPNEGVFFDYEPWRLTYKSSSFSEDVCRAYAARVGRDDLTTVQAVREQRGSREWTEYWLDVGADVYRAMGKAVRTHHPDPGALRIAYTYFFPYDDEEALWRRFRSIPKDPRRAEEHYDVNLISLYHTNGRELVDQTRLSLKHLKKPLWGISSVSRVNVLQSTYTSPEESLSPDQLEQKLVLCAALGMRVHGIWPGRGWIDGKHLEAIGRATTFIWGHEKAYFGGKPVHDAVKMTTPQEAQRSEYAYTAHQTPDGRILATAFNFTDRPLTVTIEQTSANSETVRIPPHGYATVGIDMPKVE